MEEQFITIPDGGEGTLQIPLDRIEELTYDDDGYSIARIRLRPPQVRMRDIAPSWPPLPSFEPPKAIDY